MKGKHKKIIKILIFTLVAILPFISITNIIGMDIFLDSFENPESYICLKNSDNIIELDDSNEYIIIQKSTHPDFKIDTSDLVIYFTFDGIILCSEISEIQGVGSFKRYHILDQYSENKESSIFQNQIIGKVVKTFEDNPWNKLIIKMWDISIHNLNINALMTN